MVEGGKRTLRVRVLSNKRNKRAPSIGKEKDGILLTLIVWKCFGDRHKDLVLLTKKISFLSFFEDKTRHTTFECTLIPDENKPSNFGCCCWPLFLSGPPLLALERNTHRHAIFFVFLSLLRWFSITRGIKEEKKRKGWAIRAATQGQHQHKFFFLGRMDILFKCQEFLSVSFVRCRARTYTYTHFDLFYSFCWGSRKRRMANGGTEKKRRDASESQRKSRRVGISTTRAIGGWHHRLGRKKKKNTPMTHAGEGEKQNKKREGRLSQKERRKKRKWRAIKQSNNNNNNSSSCPLSFGQVHTKLRRS